MTSITLVGPVPAGKRGQIKRSRSADQGLAGASGREGGRVFAAPLHRQGSPRPVAKKSDIPFTFSPLAQPDTAGAVFRLQRHPARLRGRFAVRAPIARTTRNPSFIPLVALALSLWGSVCGAEETKAPAAPSREEARTSAQRWFTLGRDAYKAGDYEAAVAAFRRSYELLPAPALLFNIAKALRGAGHCDDAVSYYDRFLESGVQLPADFAGLYSDAKKCASPPGGSPASATPVAPAPSEAGPSPGASQPVSEPPPKTEPAAPAAQPSEPATKHPAASVSGNDWSRGAGLACLGVSFGSAVATAVFALRAKNASDEAEQIAADGGVWDARAQDVEDDGERATNWAIGLGALTGVTAAAGVWLVLRDPDTDADAAEVHVATTPSGGTMTLRAHF